MTKYCPNCLSEYQNSATICPDDQGVLSSKRIKTTKVSSLINIYAAANVLEAQRIVGDLEQEGITAAFLENQISQYPGVGDIHFIITVDPKQKDRAIQLLTKARQNGLVSTSGTFL